MARSSSKNVKPAPGKKGKILDFSYGETEQAVKGKSQNESKEEQLEQDQTEEDQLIIGSHKSMIDSKQKQEIEEKKMLANQEAKMKNQLYFGYSDFVQSKLNPSDPAAPTAQAGFDNYSEKAWNMFIGYVLIRVIAPIILVTHCLTIILVVYWKYNFDFSVDSELTRSNAMPYVMGAMCIHSLIVHVFNKKIFSRNYYKKRGKFQRNRDLAIAEKFQERL
ncbi:hypothetical protein DAMA08_040400 [Martiniozyma asiatica (nom. inval.)]|nr:hypothetical protein DAMA08_040400 [Martiniozyma asiatica]